MCVSPRRCRVTALTKPPDTANDSKLNAGNLTPPELEDNARIARIRRVAAVFVLKGDLVVAEAEASRQAFL